MQTRKPLLDGKVALVTGAASGLGLETARLFASEGASVVATDIADERGRESIGAIRADGYDATYAHLDVRSTEQVAAAVSLAEQRYGGLHVVVANAGVLGRSSFTAVEEVSDEDWCAELDVNLTGTFRTLRGAIPALRRAGGGAIAVTSSVSGVYSTIHRLAYSAAKGGINALVRGLAAELAPERIRVNAMCPGAMPTNIRASLGRPASEIDVPLPDSTVKARLRSSDRDGTAEAARVHLFLCSDLGAYVNGETVVVDGGFSIWNGT